ncbi:MAG TPA: 30S ribosomal protein S7 [Candidatus Nanoarchaeia archaeon]|nr:30S ribosomal protein S7 [Candidatus Nanoarchaeia archaeon]
MSEIKLFGKWDTVDIKVEDPGLRDYITLDARYVPKSSGKNASNRFWKSKYHIVERLINKMMVPGHKGRRHKFSSGHCTGKYSTIYLKVIKCFELIERELNKNPIEVFVKAVENAAPREEITTIEYGGARYPQAVECSPQRRIDIALRQMIQGSFNSSHNKKIKIERCLANEIIKAYKTDQGSQAISKKLELERQADSSR